MKSTSSSIKLLLAVVVLTLSPSSSQRITLTAGGDEQQQCPMLGCCDFDCCGPGTSWDTTGEVCILDFSSEGFNGSFPSYYKKGCIERVCCEDDCCDIDTFYDVDLQCCVEAEIPSSSPLMSPTAPALAPTPTPPTATGAVKGTVFEDTNNNGKQDPGEQGILNVDVVITDKNGDTQTVTTNSNGEYSATVPADVVITDKDGDTQTATTNSNGEYSATVPAGSSQDPGDSPTAAPTPTPTGTVGGTIFDNANNNGKQDPGEQGILNADIVITDKNGSTQTVTTSSNGEYSATVPAGSTKIDIVESTLPAGGVQTVGTDPTTVSVPAGGVATDLDGFYFQTDAPTKSSTAKPSPAPSSPPSESPSDSPTAAPTPTPTGTVGGTIFDDANNNGKQDPGEQGILNADIVITDKNGSTQTVTTNSNGEYSATVPAGSTKIDIVESTLPPGFVKPDPTTVNVGADEVVTVSMNVGRGCRGVPMGTNKQIKLTKFCNHSSNQLTGYATINNGMWSSKVFTINSGVCKTIQRDRTPPTIPRKKQQIKVGFVGRNPSVIYGNTLTANDWHLTDCREYIVSIFKTKNRMTSCFNADFAPRKKCKHSSVPHKPYLEWQLTVSSVP